MPNYRRNYKKGGTYFFTVVTGSRKKILCGEMINVLRDCFKECMQITAFQMDAIIVLPDHLHCIWSLPEQDDNYSLRWKNIKSSFTKKYIRQIEGSYTPAAALINKKGEKGVWQQRFWEHTLRDDRDFRLHCDCIHYNPVKHGYVSSPGDWPYSSFNRFVAKGFYDATWGSEPVSFPEMTVRE